MAGLGSTLHGVARDLARLVLPVECPGCGVPDEVLCAACAACLDGPVSRCEHRVPRLDRMDGLPPLPVWTVADYAGPLRGVVVAWKDRSRQDLTGPLTAVAQRAGGEVAAALGPGVWVLPLLVVPVPTTAAARRRRGADLVAELARAVAGGLRGAGVPAEAAPVLRRRAAVDQVGLGARARARNTAGFGLQPGVDPRGAVHVLVDDVVTTGATLAACCRALERAGGPVLGAVVLGATPPPGRASRDAPGGVPPRIEPIRDDTRETLGQGRAGVPG